MSTTTEPQPDPLPSDDLVAYLDGELAPDDCRRVEQRLAADAEYRRQLRDLDQAWEALESLPSAKATDDFARTTMELVTVAAESEASIVAATGTQQRRNWLLWRIFAGAAAVVLGFVIASAVLPDRNRALLRDLPAIRHADALQLVPSVEFLRRLPEEVPVEKLMSDETAAKKELVQFTRVSTDSLEDRRRWIESQSADVKSKLAAQTRRFTENTPEREQERLRMLEHELRQATDCKELQETLVAYGQWVAGLTAGRQDQLREEMADLDVNDQVDLVRQFVRRQNAQASRQLSSTDAENLRKEVLAIAAERRPNLLREMRRRGDDDREPRLDGPRGALMILSRELLHEDDNDETRERLIDALSPPAREHLDNLDRRWRRFQLWQWARESLQTNVGPDELERFFADKLDNDQRERLLNLPTDEMQSRLERLYFATEFGQGNAAQWFGEFNDARDDRTRRPGRPERERSFRPDGPRRDREGDRRPHRPPPDEGPPPRD